MTEPLRWGYMGVSSTQVLDDPPVLEAWRKDLVAILTDGAEREGYRPVGEPIIHEPEPQWWVDVPDPETGEPTSILVGRHMALLGGHSFECRIEDGVGAPSCGRREEADELGKPAALAWRCEVHVEPVPDDGRTPGDTEDEG